MAKPKKNEKTPAKVTRYTYEDDKEPSVPETGHTSLMSDEDRVVTLDFDNKWTKAAHVEKLDADGKTVVVDFDPAIDPVLFWSGKRTRRNVPVLPLQRNEIVAESRIAQIIERARRKALEANSQSGLVEFAEFSDLEKKLRESEKNKRVEFYKHEEGWKNKLVCGDSLHVMQSLLEYEQMRGKVQMIYLDPPYGIKYDANFQQRIDKTKNDEKDKADDILTIKAFRDAWALGVHSYLSYLQERLYLCREILTTSGSIFLQIGDENAHLVRAMLDEVFGAKNFVAEIVFYKTSGKAAAGLDSVFDRLLWYARDVEQLKFNRLYMPRPLHTLNEQYDLVELKDGSVRRVTDEELDGKPLPDGARRFMAGDLSSQGESEEGSAPFMFKGVKYELPANTHWKTSHEGMNRLAEKNRLHPVGKRLRYKRYADDFPFAPYTNIWDDTVISGFSAPKLYAVQTSPKVVERCIQMTTDAHDIVFDPTCGSGTTAFAAEKLGRRWITCDTSRVAINVTRQRLLSGVFDHFKTRNGKVSSGFAYRTVQRITLKSLARDLEPEKVELFDQPEVENGALRVTGPFDVMTIGRYSPDDWKGYVNEGGKLENYIEVISRLYRKDAVMQHASGLIHAVAETEKTKLAISVGPLTGRVSAKQITDAAGDALALGILEVHVLGWAFEANVGEVKSRIEARGKVKLELVVIRPDTLAEGLKLTNAGSLFSPLGQPDIEVIPKTKNGKTTITVKLNGLAVFDRKKRTTDYYGTDGGYVSAWYIDEDYDGDCFVDCQMFFDFAKAPNLKAAVKGDIDDDEFVLKTESEPFEINKPTKIAVKVVDVFGNESTLVKEVKP